MKNKYYVYVYLDPRKSGNYIYSSYKFDYEPFYVGKGCGNRYLKHLEETEGTTTNILKFRLLCKLDKLGLIPIITKVSINLTESDAYKLETHLIELIGRRCDKTGTLTNILTDGKPPKNYKQLSKNIIKKIIELYNDGEYLKHIANKLGLNENKVKRTLIENGILVQRKSPINKIELTSTIITSMINDYYSGSSIRKLCDNYNLSFEIVRKTLKNNGVIFRGYNYKKTDEHIKKIWLNRVKKFGENNPTYKPLTQSEVVKIKRLRFEEGKTVREIIGEMKISQKKYYEYINT